MCMRVLDQQCWVCWMYVTSTVSENTFIQQHITMHVQVHPSLLPNPHTMQVVALAGRHCNKVHPCAPDWPVKCLCRLAHHVQVWAVMLVCSSCLVYRGGEHGMTIASPGDPCLSAQTRCIQRKGNCNEYENVTTSSHGVHGVHRVQKRGGQVHATRGRC